MIIFEPGREATTGEWRKLRNVEGKHLYFSANRTTIVKNEVV